MEETSRPYVERRGRKPNWFSRIATVIASAGWLCAIVALVLLDQAQPVRFRLIPIIAGHDPPPEVWDVALLRLSLGGLIASLVACGLGILLSNLRMKRKSDRQNKLLISLTIVSVFFTVIFLIFFAQYM